MFLKVVVKKIETQILYSIFFFENSVIYTNNVEICGRVVQVTDDNIIRRTCCECPKTQATDKQIQKF